MPSAGLQIVIGLGKSGLALVQFLLAKGFNVAVADTRAHPPGAEVLAVEHPEVATHYGELNEAFLAAAEVIYVSPGLAVSHPVLQRLQQQGIRIAGDIDVFAQYAKAPVIAITGSNAKSSVTTLVGQMAQEAGKRVAVGGNLGVPVVELLDPDAELYVLELSSFQLETTELLAPYVATCLNISEDHMDRYPEGIASYIAAKQRIFERARYAVVNRDDAQAFAPEHPIEVSYSFTLEAPASINEFGVRATAAGTFIALGEQNLLPVSALKLKGRHNLANALAALALASTIELPLASTLQTAQNFAGLPHRCQWLAEHEQVTWYNDSKGTNVGATLAALAGLADTVPGKIVLIAGGDGKGADFSPLKKPVKQECRAVILLGKDALLIEQQLAGAVPCYHVASLPEAVQLAAKLAQADDLVLLSPACASLDMFTSFEHRGEVFEQALRELIG